MRDGVQSVYKQGFLEETAPMGSSLVERTAPLPECFGLGGVCCGGRGDYRGDGKGQDLVGEEISGLCLSPLGPPELCVGRRGPFRSAHNSFPIFSSVSRTNLSLGVPKKAREDPLPVPSDQHSLPFL